MSENSNVGSPGGPDPQDNQAGQQPPTEPRRGSMRFQDPSSTTPREPSVAEQRARRQAEIDEQERAATAARQRAEDDRKRSTRRKVLIGSGVAVGLVGLVATFYAVAEPDDVTASCTDSNGIVQDDQNCDQNYATSHGGYYNSSTGFMFIPIPGGGGYRQYRYNYGGTGAIGSPVSGGSYSAPANANVTTKSGTSVQRGGFGISGKSGTSSGTGKSGGS